MVKRIGICGLLLALTGLAAASFGSAPWRPEERSAGFTDALLRLRATAGRRPPRHGLIAREVAEVFPELVHRDAAGRPRTVRYRVLTSVLLAELERLSGRVDRLEIELEALAGEAAVEPLVRITVEHE